MASRERIAIANVLEVHLQKSTHDATMADSSSSSGAAADDSDRCDYGSEYDNYDEDEWRLDNRHTIRRELILAAYDANLHIRKSHDLANRVMDRIPDKDYSIPFLCQDIAVTIRPHTPSRKFFVIICTPIEIYTHTVSFSSTPTRSSARLRAQRT